MKKAWRPVEVNYVVFTGDDNELKMLVGCANRSGDVDWRLGGDANGNTVISGYNGYHHWSEIVHKDMYAVQCGNEICICAHEKFAKTYMLANPLETKDVEQSRGPRFTDGPWFNKGKRVFWQKPDRDLPKDSLFNGLVCICATTEDDPPEVIEEANANAALIAQCTTMYKSLEDDAKSFRETAEWLKKRLGDMAIVAAMSMRADEIEKLLSKARGEK